MLLNDDSTSLRRIWLKALLIGGGLIFDPVVYEVCFDPVVRTVLQSDDHGEMQEPNKKFLDIPHESIKELGGTDLKKILVSYKEGKVGYGVGHDIESSVVQAIYDCPFLGSGVKDLDGIVVFILASPTVMDSSDVDGILRSFRQVAEWKGDIITSVLCKPDMEPRSFATTIFTIGCMRSEPSKKYGIFSRLVQTMSNATNEHPLALLGEETKKLLKKDATVFMPVKIIVNLKGRKKEFRNKAINLMKCFHNDIGELGIEESKNLQDKNMFMVFIPNKAVVQKEPLKKKGRPKSTETEVALIV